MDEHGPFTSLIYLSYGQCLDFLFAQYRKVPNGGFQVVSYVTKTHFFRVTSCDLKSMPKTSKPNHHRMGPPR